MRKEIDFTGYVDLVRGIMAQAQEEAAMWQAFEKSDLYKNENRSALDVMHWVADYVQVTKPDWLWDITTREEVGKFLKQSKEVKE